MRFLRLTGAFVAVSVLGGHAVTAKGSNARVTRFAVSVHGTFTKEWTYTRTSTVNGCSTHVTANGTRTVRLRTTSVPILTGRWAGGTARARFTGAIGVRAGIVQTGTRTTTIGTDPGCETGKHKVTCQPVNRSYAGKTTGVLSRRRHRLGLLPIRGLISADFLTTCPGEPKNVRAVGTGVELGDAKYAEGTLFASTTAGVTLQGRADATTQLGGGTGTVVQHVRLTLGLRHVG